MKGTVSVLILLLVLFCKVDVSIAQTHYLSIPYAPHNKVFINNVSRCVSIDKISSDSIFAYASDSEFETFLKLSIPFNDKLLKASLSKAAVSSSDMALSLSDFVNFDKYPSYDVYLTFMQSAVDNFPDLCRLEKIGVSVNNRDILALEISKNVNLEDTKPKLFYTSSIHGDEVCGFVLMLRLIDYMLKNEESDSLVNQLVSNFRIFINPLANPDGTYYGGNQTVASAQRYNFNDIDLNRNFPKPGIVSKSASSVEVETQAMIDFAHKHNFVLSANFHAGDEVVNFPWDTFEKSEMALPDLDWFTAVSKRYVDTTRIIDPSYMSELYSCGYVYGADWYSIEGGRQDYMLYYKDCRETTIELSCDKILSTSLFNDYWNINKRSLLRYLDEANRGFKGKVTDTEGNPLEAQIYVRNYDDLYSCVKADSVGNYTRIITGNKSYSVTAFLDGYKSSTLIVDVPADYPVTLNFVLEKGVNDFTSVSKVDDNDFKAVAFDKTISIKSDVNIKLVKVISYDGRVVKIEKVNNFEADIPAYNLPSGFYVIYCELETGFRVNKILLY